MTVLPMPHLDHLARIMQPMLADVA